MKRLPIYLLLCLIFGCTSSKNGKSTAHLLDGTWVPMQQEMGGQQLPASVYATQTLLMAGNNYTLTAESVDKGEVTYDDGKMDIFGKEGVNAGKHYMAIYKLENEQLTICYNLKCDGYPSAFSTDNAPLLFLSVFKKSVQR